MWGVRSSGITDAGIDCLAGSQAILIECYGVHLTWAQHSCAEDLQHFCMTGPQKADSRCATAHLLGCMLAGAPAAQHGICTQMHLLYRADSVPLASMPVAGGRDLHLPPQPSKWPPHLCRGI